MYDSSHILLFRIYKYQNIFKIKKMYTYNLYITVFKLNLVY